MHATSVTWPHAKQASHHAHVFRKCFLAVEEASNTKYSRWGSGHSTSKRRFASFNKNPQRCCAMLRCSRSRSLAPWGSQETCSPRRSAACLRGHSSLIKFSSLSRGAVPVLRSGRPAHAPNVLRVESHPPTLLHATPLEGYSFGGTTTAKWRASLPRLSAGRGP